MFKLSCRAWAAFGLCLVLVAGLAPATASAVPTPTHLATFGGSSSGPGHLSAPSGVARDSEGDLWVADTAHHRIQQFDSEGEFLSQFGGKGRSDGALFVPTDVAVDSDGDIWVADAGNDRVQEFSDEGQFIQQFGGTGIGNGQFDDPRSIHVDSEGGVWVADSGNDRVQRFDDEGEYLGQFGGTGSGNGQFDEPQGIAIDGEGDVWVADTGNDRIQQIDPEGEYISQFGVSGSGNGQLQAPRAIAVDSEGDVWVADTGNNRVQRFTAAGSYVSQFGGTGPGNGQFSEPRGIDVDSGGLAVGDAGNDRVQEFDSEEGFVRHFGGSSSGAGHLSAPEGVAADAQGDVWVADTAHNRIQQFDPDGEFLSQFGGKGAGPGALSSPAGVAVDSEGDVWVADSGNDRVQEFSAGGQFIQQFGSTGSGNGQLKDPQAIAIDAQGDVWVVDSGNDRVQQLDDEGEYISQFGSTGSGAGQFDSPQGLTVDNEGDVWVADTGNDRIQRFSAAGEFLGQFGASGEGEERLREPQGVAVEPEGFVWVADTGNNRMKAFFPEGEYLFGRGGTGSGEEEFSAPRGIAIDGEDIWIADTGNDRAQGLLGGPAVHFGGSASGLGHLSAPEAIAKDSEGNFWVADTAKDRIQQFDSEGEFVYYLGGSGHGEGALAEPADVAVDPEGDIWIADTGNDLVQEFSVWGFFMRQFGGTGTGDGQFTSLQGIAVDSEGNVWTLDAGAAPRVQVFNSEGEFIRKFGSTGSGNGQFENPQGIAVDGEGDVWVADTGNDRVQRFGDEGEYLSQFGSTGAGAGQLEEPQDVAVEPGGLVWVADTGNNRVQSFSAAGEYLFGLGGTGGDDGQLSEPRGIAVDPTGIAVADTGNDRVQAFSHPCPPQEAAVPREQPLELSLKCNTSGEPTYELLSEPEHGSISEFDGEAGTLTYTSEEGFVGPDSFTFRAISGGIKSNVAEAVVNVCDSPVVEVAGEAAEPETPGVGLMVLGRTGEYHCQVHEEEPQIQAIRVYIDEELVYSEQVGCKDPEESCESWIERGLQLPYAKVIGTHDYRVEAEDQFGYVAKPVEWIEETPAAGTISTLPPPTEDLKGSPGCDTPKNRHNEYVFRGQVVIGTDCADILGRYTKQNTKTYRAGKGDDVILAGGEINTIRGGPGDDRIYSGRGNDKVAGEGGNDQIVAGSGDDIVHGNTGDDTLAGSGGADEISGSDGNDYIRGGGTTDKLDGGPDTNTLSFADAVTPGFEFGSGFLSGFPGSSTGRGVYVDLGEGTKEDKGRKYTRAFNGNTSRFGGGADRLYVDNGTFQNIIGTPFADYIVGSGEANVIDGSGGADIIDGAGGHDTIYGGTEGDYINGGAGQSPGGLNGGDGDDICQNSAGLPPSCERESTEGGLKPASSGSIAVGRLNPDDPNYDMGLFVRGTSGNDVVAATWEGNEMRFVASGSGTGRFDTALNGAPSGCSVTETVAKCPTGGVHTLTMEGGSGVDTLKANKFPGAVAVTLLGGPDRDVLYGGEHSEDVLVDGTGAGKDDLYGLGDDDTFFANDGRDRLYGAGGADLFVSSTACEDVTHGGLDRDNASWAQLRGAQKGESGEFEDPINGVDASLPLNPSEWGEVTKFGLDDCLVEGTAKDGMIKEVEFLEGSGGRDALKGDNHHNILLGRSGEDALRGLGGSDNLLANNRNPAAESKAKKEDADATLDCGDQPDTLRYDKPYDKAAIKFGCERPLASAPAQWSLISGIGSDATAEAFTLSPDEAVIGGAKDPEAVPPEAFFQLDEAGGGVATNWIDAEASGSYEGGVALAQPGAMVESRGVHLDGENDRLDLTTNWDPPKTFLQSCYVDLNGYTVEMWVKFDSAPSGREELFSRSAGPDGLFVYRSADGRINFTVDRPERNPTARTDTAVSSGEWHHVVAKLEFWMSCLGEEFPLWQRMVLFVDGFEYPVTVGWAGAGYPYPLATPNAHNLVGARSTPGGLANWLNGSVDNVAIYNYPFEEGEVHAHMGISEAPEPPALLVPPPDPGDGDADSDGVRNSVDNCMEVSNPSQEDSDQDGVGDACQGEPDSDEDEVPDDSDNCPEAANKEQTDTDENGVGDACEN
jgi:streptogramin lyase/Ca2+-binding RTX toxin-like protein